jgi:hypothetical protein
LGEQAHSVGGIINVFIGTSLLTIYTTCLGTSFFLWLLGGAGVRLALGVDPLALGRGLLERFPAVCELVFERYV